MKTCIIYQLTNSVTGKKYIGVTIDFRERLRTHKKSNTVIGRALRKYGLGNFRISVLHSRLTKDTASILEKRLIAAKSTLTPDGYNVADGGYNGNNFEGKTKEEMQEIRNRMSQAQKGEKNHNFGKPRSMETRRRIGDAQKGVKNHGFGKPPSTETRRKLSIANRGYKHTPHAIKRISETHRGKTVSIEAIEKRRDTIRKRAGAKHYKSSHLQLKLF